MIKVQGSSPGYTVVETMIFLIVSSALFVSAMLLINGKQRKTEFNTAVRDLDSKIQSVIGNVSSGYYNNPGKITCTVSPGPPRAPSISATPSTQGQNQGCTFVGQSISFITTNSIGITSLAGLRLNDAGQEVQSLAEARPVGITQTRETYNLPSGFSGKMRIVGGSDLSSIIISPTFNGYNSGNLNSGSSRVQMIGYNSAGVGVTDPPSGIQICVTGSGQRGLIFMNTGSTRVTIENLSTCPW